MLVLGTDWATISSLATGAGTLVLAIATFASVRSSNRSARLAEVALQEQRRPLLAPSRLNDPVQKLGFSDRHWHSAAGGHAAVEHIDGVVYLGISLRNVGNGIAVCQGWTVTPQFKTAAAAAGHDPLDQFRLQSRDLYIPAGDIGMWQGALRNPEDPVRAGIAGAIDNRETITVELLYSDQVGGQRTITRFALIPAHDDIWMTSMSRHWPIDWVGPRPERDMVTASEAVLRDQDAADEASAARAAAAEDPAG
jgi:hypothetical protein